MKNNIKLIAVLLGFILSIKGRAWRSEGTETNSFNDVYDAWLCA